MLVIYLLMLRRCFKSAENSSLSQARCACEALRKPSVSQRSKPSASPTWACVSLPARYVCATRASKAWRGNSAALLPNTRTRLSGNEISNVAGITVNFLNQHSIGSEEHTSELQSLRHL